MSKFGVLGLAVSGAVTAGAIYPATFENVPFCNEGVLEGAKPGDVTDLCNDFKLYVDRCAGIGMEPLDRIKNGMGPVVRSISNDVEGQVFVSLSCVDGQVSGGVRLHRTQDHWLNVAGIGPKILHLGDSL